MAISSTPLRGATGSRTTPYDSPVVRVYYAGVVPAVRFDPRLRADLRLIRSPEAASRSRLLRAWASRPRSRAGRAHRTERESSCPRPGEGPRRADSPTAPLVARDRETLTESPRRCPARERICSTRVDFQETLDERIENAFAIPASGSIPWLRSQGRTLPLAAESERARALVPTAPWGRKL